MFVRPIDKATAMEAFEGAQQFRISSRIAGMLRGKKSAGASCNVFEMQDNLESIAEGVSWSIHVLGYQGAPTIYLGNLRPDGTPIASGGTASGALSFALPLDKHFATMRRTEKKNGAGQLIMPWNYPSRSELIKFLRYPFEAAYRAVYVPMHDTLEAEEFLADTELVELLAQYYDNFSTFLVKRPIGGNLTNLCTEIELPPRGTCVLGAVNASAYYFDAFLNSFPRTMAKAAKRMYTFMELSNEYIKHTPIYCNSPDNRQFGLGLYGLASFLGANNVSYAEFGDVLLETIDMAGGEGSDISEVSSAAHASYSKSKAHQIVSTLAIGYAMATRQVKHLVNAAFCFQPTVSTAHSSFDVYGYHASPELQPVQGIRHEDAVSTLIKSQQKGDKIADYHPQTITVYETPYSDYVGVSSGMQQLINSTGLAHRHSHCYYGEKFTGDTLRSWYADSTFKHIRSLYYRLKFSNQDSLKKDSLWQDTDGIVDPSFDVDTFLQDIGQSPGQITCDCAM